MNLALSVGASMGIGEEEERHAPTTLCIFIFIHQYAVEKNQYNVHSNTINLTKL